MYESCSKLTIKTLDTIVNFEQISHIIQLFQLLTLIKYLVCKKV